MQILTRHHKQKTRTGCDEKLDITRYYKEKMSQNRNKFSTVGVHPFTVVCLRCVHSASGTFSSILIGCKSEKIPGKF